MNGETILQGICIFLSGILGYFVPQTLFGLIAGVGVAKILIGLFGGPKC